MYVFKLKELIKYTAVFVLIHIVILSSIYIFWWRKDSKETVALPVSNKVIILDAGHGIPDSGAESKNGVTEEAINLKITFKVKELLEQSGALVVLTRSDENGIYDLEAKSIKEKKTSDLKNRVNIANGSNADIFVSIHLNKINESKYKGWQTFFNPKSSEGERLSKCIQKGIGDAVNVENKREAHTITGKYITEHIVIPTTIVECGFLSNPEEEALLQTEEYQEKIAWGIYLGIMDYFY